MTLLKDLTEEVVSFSDRLNRKRQEQNINQNDDAEYLAKYDEFVNMIRQAENMIMPEGRFGEMLTRQGQESERLGLIHHLDSVKLVAVDAKRRRNKK